VARIVVLGGGICGTATAILLARDGYEVTVLERDAEPVPESVDEAWSAWMRPGVARFRQPHFLQARVRHVLDRELSDVRDALLAAGAATVDPIARLPAAIEDRGRRAGDERFVSITARRTTTEHVFARAAENEPRVTVRRGVEVTALDLHQVDGTSHLTGVRTSSGEALKADLTVDAMGRGSRLPRLLRDAGAARLHQEAENSGFIYYTRFFRSADGACPEPRTPALVTPLGSISILTLPSDCDTWSVTFFISSGDQPLKRLRFVDRWTAVVAACPLHAHWLEGEPISDVLPMAGVLDRYRRLRPTTDRDWTGHRRRLVGMHEPVARPRSRARPRPRGPSPRYGALGPGGSSGVRARLRCGDRGRVHALVPSHGRNRPGTTGRNGGVAERD
jgi:2-polyprenyl-6-methoxyphenol hydroxylase-like FAD-dependent oxidoreductase